MFGIMFQIQDPYTAITTLLNVTKITHVRFQKIVGFPHDEVLHLVQPHEEVAVFHVAGEYFWTTLKKDMVLDGAPTLQTIPVPSSDRVIRDWEQGGNA